MLPGENLSMQKNDYKNLPMYNQCPHAAQTNFRILASLNKPCYSLYILIIVFRKMQENEEQTQAGIILSQ